MIVVCIILLILGGAVGYWWGVQHSHGVNDVLITQNTFLSDYADGWFQAAKRTSQLTQDIAQRHTGNIAASMNMVIQILNAIRSQQSTVLDTQMQQKVDSLIQQAKSIAGHNERKE